MYVPEVIRNARTEAGMSQEGLAALAGTSQATLSAYEAGAKAPAIETLARLLAAAGYRLRAEPAPRRIRQPSEAELERRGRTLAEVIALAESLPVSHERELRYPRLRPRQRDDP